MKLEWHRTKTHSIAESGDHTVICVLEPDEEWSSFGRSVDGKSEILKFCILGRDAAEASCESWLDAQDRPQWLETPNKLAACCEWRGWWLLAVKTLGDKFDAEARTSLGNSPMSSRLLQLGSTVDSFAAAKESIEAEVRKASAG